MLKVIEKKRYMMQETNNNTIAEQYPKFKDCMECLQTGGITKFDGMRLILQDGGKVYATRLEAKLGKLKEEDIEELDIEKLPLESDGKKAMIYSQTYYCQKCLAEAVPFGAALDDMAMIIGKGMFIADGRTADRKSGKTLKKAFKKSNACFVLKGVDGKGKGIGYTIAMGKDLKEAAITTLVAEKAAYVELKAKNLGGCSRFDRRTRSLLRKKYEKSYSVQKKAASTKTKDDFSEAEYELRTEIAKYGRRLVSERLVQGTWGNISAKLDDNTIIVTPSGVEYAKIEPEDLVKVDLSTLAYEGENKPTSELELHAAIYRAKPDAGAVVHTHSANASVYACAHCGLEIPEENARATEVFGSFVAVTEYAAAGTKAIAQNVVSAMGESRGAIMANHGMAVCGADMKNAFENALLLEDTAGKELKKL